MGPVPFRGQWLPPGQGQGLAGSGQGMGHVACPLQVASAPTRPQGSGWLRGGRGMGQGPVPSRWCQLPPGPNGDWLAQDAEGDMTQTEQRVRDTNPFPSRETYSVNNDAHGVSISNRLLEVPRLVWREAWDRGEQHKGAEICTPLALPPL